jgi:hypothetical protein
LTTPRPTSTCSTKARGSRGQRLVEAEHEGGVDPGGGEQVELLREAAHGLRAQFGAQQAQGVAIERDGHHPRPGILRGDTRTVDHRTMSGVHAVELADRDDAGAEPGRHLRGVVKDDHQLELPRCARRPGPPIGRGCRGIRLFGALAASAAQPPQTDERQHERHPEVAEAIARPDGRVVEEELGMREAERSDDEHACQLEADRHPGHEVPPAAVRLDEGNGSEHVDDGRRAESVYASGAAAKSCTI